MQDAGIHMAVNVRYSPARGTPREIVNSIAGAASKPRSADMKQRRLASFQRRLEPILT
jgi:hypothetical protein